MAIKCLKCGYVIKGVNGLHLIKKCPNKNCENTEIDKFIRIECDEEDNIVPEEKEKEREWLESHHIEEE